MNRRYGEPPLSRQPYTRRPGVYAVLLRGGQLLTTLQRDPVPEFQLPGGGIDRGEHPVAALHREVREETGWRIRLRCRVGAFRRFTFMPEYDLWAEKLCSIYLADPVRPLGPPTEPGHSAVWMPVAEALWRLGNPGDRAMLARCLSAHPAGQAAAPGGRKWNMRPDTSSGKSAPPRWPSSAATSASSSG